MPDAISNEYPTSHNQWRNCALLIVGHGSTENPDSSAPTHHLVDELRSRGIFREVNAAFWKEDASMREALAMLDSKVVFIVPTFISEGYFTTEVIPREFGIPSTPGVCKVKDKTIIHTKPVGAHPSMSRLLLKRAYEVIGETPPGECSLLVVGHGTVLNAQSRAAVEQRVAEIQSSDNRFAEVIDSYMEETPLISGWHTTATMNTVVVVPFFIADGLHSYQDIPVLLGMESEPTEAASQREIFRHNPHHLRGKTLYYSPAIGTDPSMVDVILDLVRESSDQFSLPAHAPHTNEILKHLQNWIASLPQTLGEILIQPHEGGFTLSHRDDRDTSAEKLERFTTPSAARDIALYTDKGEYRPLKTSPDLRHGWQLQVSTIEELLNSLDYFYPAATGLSLLHTQGKLRACHLRDKLGRQSGMYRSARTISDRGANALINHCCNHGNGCLKHRLWGLTRNRATELPTTKPQGAVDLICQEPCNIIVAEARKVARSEVIRVIG